MQNCRCEPVQEGIGQLAEHPAIVIVTYGMFAVWVLFSKDFMTEKWRTIRNTRRLGYAQIVISIVPLPVFVFYAAVQGIAGDHKEMMAALVGFLFLGQRGLLRLFGDAYGLMALNTYQVWSTDVLERMKCLGMEAPSDINKKLALSRVNNLVVDNEVDSSVKIKKFEWSTFRKLVSLLRTDKRERQHAKTCSENHEERPGFLTTDKGELFTVRWGGAFLSTFGNVWGGRQAVGYIEELFVSCKKSLRLLEAVTFPVKGARVRMSDLIYCSEEIGAFGAMNHLDGIQIMGALKKRTSELEDLMNDYPSDNNRIDQACYPFIELVHAVLFCKAMDCEALKALKHYSSNFSLSGSSSGWQLFLWQNEELPVDNDLGTLDKERVPLFPWQYLMVPLWDKCTNWRVLQATAHKDNKFRIYAPDSYYPPQTTQPCYFEHTRKFIVENAHHYTEFRFSGALMETVRSFLAC